MALTKASTGESRSCNDNYIKRMCGAPRRNSLEIEECI